MRGFDQFMNIVLDKATDEKDGSALGMVVCFRLHVLTAVYTCSTQQGIYSRLGIFPIASQASQGRVFGMCTDGDCCVVLAVHRAKRCFGKHAM